MSGYVLQALFTFKMFSEGRRQREVIVRAHFNIRDPIILELFKIDTYSGTMESWLVPAHGIRMGMGPWKATRERKEEQDHPQGVTKATGTKATGSKVKLPLV